MADGLGPTEVPDSVLGPITADLFRTTESEGAASGEAETSAPIPLPAAEAPEETRLADGLGPMEVPDSVLGPITADLFRTTESEGAASGETETSAPIPLPAAEAPEETRLADGPGPTEVPDRPAAAATTYIPSLAK
ncbi:MAG: hypothetical protein WC382_12515 [Methanoregulaceae archaeon]